MNKKIFDRHGIPINEQHVIKYGLEVVCRNWKTLLPIVVSFGALVVSIYATNIAVKADERTSKLAKLDFYPIIRLNTQFTQVRITPPYFMVTNVGPIEAQQIKIKMYTHRYVKQSEISGVSIGDLFNDVCIPKLAPSETRAFKFNESWININSKPQHPVENNIMEIKITFLRPQDLKKYDRSGFYFANADGAWIPESDSSLNVEFYKKIKEALFKGREAHYDIIYRESGGDLLHSNP